MTSAVDRAKGLRAWYDIRAISEDGQVYIAEEDRALLLTRVNTDPGPAAVFGLNQVRYVPAWTLDVGYVNTLRRRVERRKLKVEGLGR